jgi:hypothetical protein
MSSLLWNMFTGSAPYTEMFRGTLHPGFIGNLMVSVGSALWPQKSLKSANVNNSEA